MTEYGPNILRAVPDVTAKGIIWRGPEARMGPDLTDHIRTTILLGPDISYNNRPTLLLGPDISYHIRTTLLLGPEISYHNRTTWTRPDTSY